MIPHVDPHETKSGTHVANKIKNVLAQVPWSCLGIFMYNSSVNGYSCILGNGDGA